MMDVHRTVDVPDVVPLNVAVLVPDVVTVVVVGEVVCVVDVVGVEVGVVEVVGVEVGVVVWVGGPRQTIRHSGVNRVVVVKEVVVADTFSVLS
jgi:hypothetical protein